MSTIEELPIPDVVIAARQKAEMARIWIADGDQIVTLSARLWEDPGAWGLMLVDLARHVARAYESRGISAAVALAQIRSALDAEWVNSTDRAH
jgi:hypothetical protein